MRYLGIFLFLLAVIAITAKLSDKLCIPEHDAVICSSTGIDCGVNITMTDTCGELRQITCKCIEMTTCDERTLKCLGAIGGVSPLLADTRYIIICDHLTSLMIQSHSLQFHQDVLNIMKVE